MVLEYFTSRKPKKQSSTIVKDDQYGPKSPVLKDEDEAFLQRITSAGSNQPSSSQAVTVLDTATAVKGKDAQLALMDGADEIPLPSSPAPVEESAEATREVGGPKSGGERKKKSKYLSYLPVLPKFMTGKGQTRKKAATAVKTGESPQAGGVDLTSEEGKEEHEQMNSILDRLNLSAWNNRAISISKESQKLMDDFTQILKDIVNGVPTAYDDLEKLLTNSESQLSSMFGNMPQFLQKFVKSLPTKMGASLAPELLLAGSGKPGFDGAAGSKAKKKRFAIPNLKTLVTKQGAAVAMLRSILNFLELRFPAFIGGTNILMSLAVFILLFVFWYCWKRGKETRLAKEQLAAGETAEMENSASDLEDSAVLGIDEQDAEVQRLQALLNKPDPAHVPLPATRDEELRDSGHQSK